MNMMEDIESALIRYFDSFYDGDVLGLRSLFLDLCKLHTVEDGVLRTEDRDDWLARVGGRPSARSQGLTRHDRIVSVDACSNTIASAKVECAIPPRFFTDYLTLVRVGDRWKVAAWAPGP